MKPFSNQPFPSRRKERHSAALIIILGCMVILSAVLLAFLSSAKTELVSSRLYADNNNVQTLMNTCVNMVMAQVRQATTAVPTDCWTSQPGLIRTFNNAGAPDMSYKLYSSDIMQTNIALNPATEEAALANWSTQPAVFTDLNDPVGGVYPIVDPAALNVPVQGFSIGTNAPTTQTQAAPMPVKWLYVLNDGTLAPGVVAGTGNTATVAGATSSNPIVGRVAFWTDDESCKVNINTASEGGSFNGASSTTTGTNTVSWDIPRFNNVTDENLGLYQPTENEFQLYPGHPAGVSLSTVFPSLVTSGPAKSAFSPFYAIAPRIQSGGSYNGTAVISTTSSPVVLDGDRLYDSIDELLFNPNRQSNPTTPPLTQTQVEQAKFFITAHSRAPETTLFGTPKVACWPINANLAANPASPYASAFDRLIAFCSTVNNNLYYFQRQNKDSQTYDYLNIPRNQTLYSYLHTLMNTNVPGFGGNLGNKFGIDSDQVLTEIFDYIRCTNLNDLNLAALPATSAPYYQYGAGGTSRLYGQAEVAPITISSPSGASTRGFGRFVTISEASLWLICTADPANAASNVSGNLTLAPATPPLTGGQLLTSTATTKQLRIEAALILDPFTPMHGVVPMRPDVEILVSGLDQWTIKGNADPTTPNPNLAFPAIGQQTYTGSGVYQLGVQPSNVSSNYNWGGYMGTDWALASRCLCARNSGRLPVDAKFSTSVDGSGGPLNEQYPFVSQPVTVNVTQTNPSLSFSGGPITITIRQRTSGTIQSATPSAPGAVIQTLTINFPPTPMPPPILYTTTSGTSANFWTFQAGGCGLGSQGRFSTANSSGDTPAAVETADDVIYSMVPAQGGQTLDPRFVALMPSSSSPATPGALFTKHPYYGALTSAGTLRSLANTLMPLAGDGLDWVPSGSAANNPNTGTLASGISSYSTFKFWPCPKVPYPATAAMASGDWDNGVGDQEDGGYVNEPDQGTIASPSTTGTYADPYYGSGVDSLLSFTSPSRMMPSPGMFGSLPTTFLRSEAANFTGGSNVGWQTLLFRRQPGHPEYPASNGNFINDPDYLMMDLFWMPVVEPYAISEMLSTAGKINMNYQIIPFTYLERQTGLYAALKHESVIAVPNSDATIYKGIYSAINASANYRLPIQIGPTLNQFEYRFNNTDNTGLYAYRTPAEICDVNLIPNDPSYSLSSTGSDSAIDAMMASYWSQHSLTGDNSRERPYTTIYPRLTTRSNTFRVHYRVQTVKKIPGSNPALWNEQSDIVTSEGRGSVLIERYLDANDTTIPDYAANPATTPTLESHYQFRVVSTNRFPP